MTTMLITEMLVDPDYRNEIQMKYFACDEEGNLLNEKALTEELMPALGRLVQHTDRADVIAHAIGMGMFIGWHLGYTNLTPEDKKVSIEMCELAYQLSPNNPSSLAGELIARDVDPQTARKWVMPRVNE